MDKKQLMDILQMLRSEIMALQGDATDSEIQVLMRKYHVVFTGKKYNNIYSYDLRYILQTKLGIEISLDELNVIIPEVCADLKMKIEPLMELKDANKTNPPTSCYQISLF